MTTRPRIAVVSPFLDKRHGTERCISEQVEHLAYYHGYDVHIYSQYVEDIVGIREYPCNSIHNGRHHNAHPYQEQGTIWWHRVPGFGWPGFIQYLWWFIANHLWRWWHRKVYGLTYDLVYSPGINCLDADAITVHVVFAQLYRQVQPEISLRTNLPRVWPWLFHRQLLYNLFIFLEQRIYPRKDLALIAISHKTARALSTFYRQGDILPVIHNAVNTQQFNPHVRTHLRSLARTALGITEHTCVLLLIGNGWQNKGLPALLQALSHLSALSLLLLVVGHDQVAPYHAFIQQHNLAERVRFLPPRPDVEWYYAAADLYVAPSIEDAFALPPAEAMACGLPVIVSSCSGLHEIISDGEDGLILHDPRDPEELAGLIKKLYTDPMLRERFGAAAIHTMAQHTWEDNTARTHMIFQQVLQRKRRDSRGA